MAGPNSTDTTSSRRNRLYASAPDQGAPKAKRKSGGAKAKTVKITVPMGRSSATTLKISEAKLKEGQKASKELAEAQAKVAAEQAKAAAVLNNVVAGLAPFVAPFATGIANPIKKMLGHSDEGQAESSGSDVPKEVYTIPVKADPKAEGPIQIGTRSYGSVTEIDVCDIPGGLPPAHLEGGLELTKMDAGEKEAFYISKDVGGVAAVSIEAKTPRLPTSFVELGALFKEDGKNFKKLVKHFTDLSAKDQSLYASAQADNLEIIQSMEVCREDTPSHPKDGTMSVGEYRLFVHRGKNKLEVECDSNISWVPTAFDTPLESKDFAILNEAGFRAGDICFASAQISVHPSRINHFATVLMPRLQRLLGKPEEEKKVGWFDFLDKPVIGEQLDTLPLLLDTPLEPISSSATDSTTTSINPNVTANLPKIEGGPSEALSNMYDEVDKVVSEKYEMEELGKKAARRGEDIENSIFKKHIEPMLGFAILTIGTYLAGQASQKRMEKRRQIERAEDRARMDELRAEDLARAKGNTGDSKDAVDAKAFVENLSEKAKQPGFSKLVDAEATLQTVRELLSSPLKPHLVIEAVAGSGKTELVRAIAAGIATGDPAWSQFHGLDTWSLDLVKLDGEAAVYVGKDALAWKAFLEEVKPYDKESIIFIDEAQIMIKPKDQANAFMKGLLGLLTDPNCKAKFVPLTNEPDKLRTNPAFEGRFQWFKYPVINWLKGLRNIFRSQEKFITEKANITYDAKAMELIVKMAAKHEKMNVGRAEPSRVKDFMSEIAGRVIANKKAGEKFEVTEDYVYKYLKDRYGLSRSAVDQFLKATPFQEEPPPPEAEKPQRVRLETPAGPEGKVFEISLRTETSTYSLRMTEQAMRLMQEFEPVIKTASAQMTIFSPQAEAAGLVLNSDDIAHLISANDNKGGFKLNSRQPVTAQQVSDYLQQVEGHTASDIEPYLTKAKAATTSAVPSTPNSNTPDSKVAPAPKVELFDPTQPNPLYADIDKMFLPTDGTTQSNNSTIALEEETGVFKRPTAATPNATQPTPTIAASSTQPAPAATSTPAPDANNSTSSQSLFDRLTTEAKAAQQASAPSTIAAAATSNIPATAQGSSPTPTPSTAPDASTASPTDPTTDSKNTKANSKKGPPPPPPPAPPTGGSGTGGSGGTSSTPAAANGTQGTDANRTAISEAEAKSMAKVQAAQTAPEGYHNSILKGFNGFVMGATPLLFTDYLQGEGHITHEERVIFDTVSVAALTKFINASTVPHMIAGLPTFMLGAGVTSEAVAATGLAEQGTTANMMLSTTGGMAIGHGLMKVLGGAEAWNAAAVTLGNRIGGAMYAAETRATAYAAGRYAAGRTLVAAGTESMLSRLSFGVLARGAALGAAATVATAAVVYFSPSEAHAETGDKLERDSMMSGLKPNQIRFRHALPVDGDQDLIYENTVTFGSDGEVLESHAKWSHAQDDSNWEGHSKTLTRGDLDTALEGIVRNQNPDWSDDEILSEVALQASEIIASGFQVEPVVKGVPWGNVHFRDIAQAARTYGEQNRKKDLAAQRNVLLSRRI